MGIESKTYASVVLLEDAIELQSQLATVTAERDGLLSARDDLGASNGRLQSQLATAQARIAEAERLLYQVGSLAKSGETDVTPWIAHFSHWRKRREKWLAGAREGATGTDCKCKTCNGAGPIPGRPVIECPECYGATHGSAGWSQT
jgi:hypothetical protein